MLRRFSVIQSSGFVSPWMLLLLLFAVGVVMAYAVLELRSRDQTIGQLDQQLEQAERTISKFQLIMARLEKQIISTDATMAQSGNELARELKRLDDELRSQGAYLNELDQSITAGLQSQDASRSADLAKTLALIEGFTAQLRDHEQRAGQMRDEIDALQAALQVQQTRDETLEIALQTRAAAALTAATEREDLYAGLDSLARRIDAVNRSQDTLLDTLQATQSAQQEELLSLTATLTERPVVDPAFASQQQSLAQQVQRIDTARRQIVQRFLDLDARLQSLEADLQQMQNSR